MLLERRSDAHRQQIGAVSGGWLMGGGGLGLHGCGRAVGRAVEGGMGWMMGWNGGGKNWGTCERGMGYSSRESRDVYSLSSLDLIPTQ